MANAWTRNYLRLMNMVDYIYSQTVGKLERMLVRLRRHYRDPKVANDPVFMLEQMAKIKPSVRRLVNASGMAGAYSTLTARGYDLRGEYQAHFQHDMLPDRVTLSTVEDYLNHNGADTDALQQQFDRHFARLDSSIADKVAEQVRISIAEARLLGADRRRTQNAIQSALAEMGLDSGNAIFPNTETVVRTEMQNTMQGAAWKAAVDNEGIWGFRYSCIMDSRSRESHRAQNGVTQPIDSEFWKIWVPPNGYNCRCDIIALYAPPKNIKEPDWRFSPDEGFAYNPGISLGGVL